MSLISTCKNTIVSEFDSLETVQTHCFKNEQNAPLDFQVYQNYSMWATGIKNKGFYVFGIKTHEQTKSKFFFKK